MLSVKHFCYNKSFFMSVDFFEDHSTVTTLWWIWSPSASGNITRFKTVVFVSLSEFICNCTSTINSQFVSLHFVMLVTKRFLGIAVCYQLTLLCYLWWTLYAYSALSLLLFFDCIDVCPKLDSYVFIHVNENVNNLAVEQEVDSGYVLLLMLHAFMIMFWLFAVFFL